MSKLSSQTQIGRTHGASAKSSGHWDTGHEFCAPDPIFKLVVVLSSCGYGLSYWGAGVFLILGNAVEFEEPDELLKIKGGMLKELVD